MGSKAIFPYGCILGVCQPDSAVQTTWTMWAVVYFWAILPGSCSAGTGPCSDVGTRSFTIAEASSSARSFRLMLTWPEAGTDMVGIVALGLIFLGKI